MFFRDYMVIELSFMKCQSSFPQTVICSSVSGSGVCGTQSQVSQPRMLRQTQEEGGGGCYQCPPQSEWECSHRLGCFVLLQVWVFHLLVYTCITSMQCPRRPERASNQLELQFTELQLYEAVL